MLKLRLTYISGKSKIVTVDNAAFVTTCPYCRKEFDTIDPDQVYCCTNHRIYACQVRTFSRSLPRALAASTIGLRLSAVG